MFRVSGNAGGSSIWYRWTAPATGPYSFNTFGSTFDTLLAVYIGTSVDALTVVASNDDYGVDVTSEVGFAATAGTTYSIALDGFLRQAGMIALHWFKLSDTTVTGALQTLRAFTNFNDGGSPFAGVTLSGSTLYGTTLAGAGFGTLFKVNTDGTSERGGELAWGSVYRVSWESERPRLAITSSGDDVLLTWPDAGAFTLESTFDLGLSSAWSTVGQPATTNSGQISVTVPATGPVKHFRLKSP